MKNLIFSLLLLTLTVPQLSAQGARPQVVCDCFQCCPQVLTITIDGTYLDSLHADSLAILTPSPNKAIRLTKPPVIRTYHDGASLIFASGEELQVINEFGGPGGYGGGLLSSFGDPLITPYEGTSAGSFWHSYFMPFNGQNTPSLPTTCTGTIYAWATYPITGGGANAKIVLTIWYEEIPYQP